MDQTEDKNTHGKKVKKKIRNKHKHKIIVAISLTMLFIVAIGTGLIFAIIKSSPALDINQILDLNQTSVIYDDKGNAMDDVLTTDENGQVAKRTDVTINNTSPYLGQAFIAIEDERFRQHGGVDLKGITRAVFVDVQNKVFHSSKSTQGASTLTQQLIKSRLFLEDSLNNRLDYTRKLQEAYLAIELEKSMSKDDILEAYMNTIYLGGNAYGVEAAAYQYFSKTSKNLTLVESAFIAGMAQSPSGLYPFSTSAKKNPAVYLNKTKLVLSKMHETNVISQKDYDDALNSIKKNKIIFTRPNVSLDKYTYEYFSRPVVEQIKSDLKSQYNYSSSQVMTLLMSGGLKIYTTMNKDLQNKSQKIVNEDPIFNKVYNTSNNSIQSSAVILDYHTGQVKAIIGGRGNQPARSYNRAVDAINFPRSTGSSIKPLTVYAAAIDSKIASASTTVYDSPLAYETRNKYASNGVPYNPSDDNQPRGAISMYSAIKTSQNLAAVNLEDKIGVSTGYAYAQKFGLSVTSADKNIATMSLGQFHGGETPLLMAAAYGVFGNSGMYAKPRLYTKILDRTGKVLLATTYTTKEVLTPQSAYTMYDLLKGPVTTGGTGTNAQFGDMPVSGKTGTATDSKDLWFCGLTPHYSAAIWIGNDDAKKFYNLSSNDAALLWGQLMKVANLNLSTKDITPPYGVTATPKSMDSQLDTTVPSKVVNDTQKTGKD